MKSQKFTLKLPGIGVVGALILGFFVFLSALALAGMGTEAIGIFWATFWFIFWAVIAVVVISALLFLLIVWAAA